MIIFIDRVKKCIVDVETPSTLNIVLNIVDSDSNEAIREKATYIKGIINILDNKQYTDVLCVALLCVDNCMDCEEHMEFYNLYNSISRALLDIVTNKESEGNSLVTASYYVKDSVMELVFKDNSRESSLFKTEFELKYTGVK